MLQILNLVFAFAVFLLLLVIMVGENAKKQEILSGFYASIIYQRKAIRGIILEITWLYLVFSLIVFFGLTLETGLLFAMLIGLGGLIVIAIDLSYLDKRSRFESEEAEYIQTIEYMFRSKSESQVLDALNGLGEEAIDNDNARTALEKLSQRNDALGEFIRSNM